MQQNLSNEPQTAPHIRDHKYNHEYLKTIAHCLMAQRLQNGWTVDQAAEHSNGELSAGNIKAIEKGLYYYSIRNLLSYCQLLNFNFFIVPKSKTE